MQKRKVISVVLGVFIICISITAVLTILLKNPKNKAYYYRKYTTPDTIVQIFLVALTEDYLNLAEELVIPKLRDRIDQWNLASGHEASPCPHGDLIEPFAWSSWSFGSGGSEFNDNTTTIDHYIYGCYYGNGAYISIESVTLERSGGSWAITGWDKICESTGSTPAICH